MLSYKNLLKKVLIPNLQLKTRYYLKYLSSLARRVAKHFYAHSEKSAPLGALAKR